MKTRLAALAVVLLLLGCRTSTEPAPDAVGTQVSIMWAAAATLTAEPTPDAVASQVSVMRAAAATLTAEATVQWVPTPTLVPAPTEVPTVDLTAEEMPSPTATVSVSPSPTAPTSTPMIPTAQPVASATPMVETPAPTTMPTSTLRPTRRATSTPTSVPPPSPTDDVPVPSGRITFSAGGILHVVDAATGHDTVAPIPDMRQPDFRADGDLIIAKGFMGSRTSLWTIDARTGTFVREQTDFSDDFHPSWSPDGTRFVYDSMHRGFSEYNLYTQRLDTKDDELLRYEGMPIIGTSPVWLSDDWIAFTGCDYWPGGSGGSNCGIYRLPSWSDRPFLVHAGSLTLRATDEYGARLLIMSEESGDWEVYIKPLSGAPALNLSSSSTSSDGLGTFSPDGSRVAFVSSRGGGWAVWAVMLDGSGLTRLFGLPAELTGLWTEESMSWGP